MLDGINSQITSAEKWKGELKYRMMEIHVEEQNKEKEWKELRTVAEKNVTLNVPNWNYRGLRRRREREKA